MKKTVAKLVAEHDRLCLAERDHHAIAHCLCDVAIAWRTQTKAACPACKNPDCNCVVCDGEGWTRDEETGEREGCLVCTGEYWGGRRQ